MSGPRPQAGSLVAALVTLALVTTVAVAAAFGVVVWGPGANVAQRTAGSAVSGEATASAPTPLWAPATDTPPPEYDRNYKLDLVEALDEPPQLVVLGGSRAQRFEPSYIRELTGLGAFNFAVQNSRPEDAYAMTLALLSRAPAVKLRVFYAVQVTTFNDRVMHPGILYDARFARWFPEDVIAAQRQELGAPPPDGLPDDIEYSPRGCLLYNRYDRYVERGRPLERALATWLERLVPNAASPLAEQSRSRLYFEKLLRVCNDRGVTPAIVVMPQHPVGLEAFREVGWQEKNDALLAYLRGLEGAYDLRVLDYTEIASFGGKARYFYDGSHVTRENARLILEQAVRDAPECFR